MKKIFTVVMAVAFAFSVVGFAVAADNAVKAAPAAEKASKPKAKAVTGTGTIEALDAAAGTMTMKGKKGSVDLKAGKNVKLDSFKVGDTVSVTYADGTASSVKAVKGKKTTTKTETKTETKTTTETMPAAPAPAPAPVKK